MGLSEREMRTLLVLILALLTGMVMAQPQSSKKITMAYDQDIVNASHAHYAIPVSGAWDYSMQWYITSEGIETIDTATIYFEGSIDNTTWYKTSLPGTPVSGTLTNTTITYYSGVPSTNFTPTTGAAWNGGSIFYAPTFCLTPPYFRATVTHGGTGTITVSGYLYAKP
jgi:hypothetical protein